MSAERSVFFDVDGHLVKLGMVKDPDCPVVLKRSEGRWLLTMPLEAGPLEVHPLKARYHAPGMAFFHLGSGCRYDCAFCTVPEEAGYGGSERTEDDWLRLVSDALEDDPGSSVAFTSGVGPGRTEADEVRFMAGVVSAVTAKYPGTPVGVEPYTTSGEDVRLLHDAGAAEFKLNVETATPEKFRALCPSLDRTGIMSALAVAVDIFGRGKVCSNLLVGIGETEEETMGAVDELASLGVVATLRALRVNDANRGKLESALGRSLSAPDAAGLMDLCQRHGETLRRHGLSPATFTTMCHRCTACDLVPDRDIEAPPDDEDGDL
jgi:biotin synthase-related radical SAM superfamily protein